MVGQIAHAVFRGGLPFYIVQFFTSAILILAANTAYQDFPRLSSILARDRFMPRQFANRGDRLVFSNGVIVLGILASVLIVVFEADLNRLIQLYVVGVFTAFTLSQTGMIRHWLKEKHKGAEAQKGWRRSIVINSDRRHRYVRGALVIVSFTKFIEGAWIVFVAVPIIMFTFISIHRHYTAVMAQLRRGTVRPGELGRQPRGPARARPGSRHGGSLGLPALVPPGRRPRRVSRSKAARCRRSCSDRWRVFAGAGTELEPLVCRGDDLLAAMQHLPEERSSAHRPTSSP